jgi:hypothetical protein
VVQHSVILLQTTVKRFRKNWTRAAVLANDRV